MSITIDEFDILPFSCPKVDIAVGDVGRSSDLRPSTIGSKASKSEQDILWPALLPLIGSSYNEGKIRSTLGLLLELTNEISVSGIESSPYDLPLGPFLVNGDL